MAFRKRLRGRGRRPKRRRGKMRRTRSVRAQRIGYRW